MLNKRRKRFRDITEARPSQFPYGYVYKGSTVPYQSQYLITPPYPVRPEDGLTVSVSVSVQLSTTAYHLTESVTFSLQPNSFVLVQTFFPVDYDYTQDGQSAPHEDITFVLQPSSFQLGATLIPREYQYKQSGQTSTNYHEDVTFSLAPISFALGAEIFPLEYTNWPVESVSFSLTPNSFSLG